GGGVEAIQWSGDQPQKHRGPPPISEPGNAQWDREQFYAGRAAMYVDGPWNFVNVRSKLKDDWDITLLPRGRAGSITWVAGSGFGISATCNQRQEAYHDPRFINSTGSPTNPAQSPPPHP